jgi:hypothetical protein
VSQAADLGKIGALRDILCDQRTSE